MTDINLDDLDFTPPEPQAPPAFGGGDIVHVQIDTIMDRPEDMRTKMEGLEELADSIYRIGLLHPVVLDDKNQILAGKRRWEAYKILYKNYGEKFWTIPARYFNELYPEDKLIIELDENAKRIQLHWKDKAHAVTRLFELTKKCNPNWTVSAICGHIGISSDHVRACVKVSEALNANDGRVLQAQSFVTAVNILERDDRRKKDMQLNEILDIDTATPVIIEEAEEAVDEAFHSDYTVQLDKPKEIKAPQLVLQKQELDAAIQQGDFHAWASTYTGRKFNFIHCDFPYGINHGKSDVGCDVGAKLIAVSAPDRQACVASGEASRIGASGLTPYFSVIASRRRSVPVARSSSLASPAPPPSA